jgi:hypothetical protein
VGVSQHASARTGNETDYIGIVSDKIDEQRAVESPAKSDDLMKNYLRRLMSAMLKQRSGIR